MPLHYEQVENWLHQNKSRLTKPAFIQNLFYKHVHDSIEHEPEFPIYLLVAISLTHGPDTRSKLFAHWRKQYPSLLEDYYITYFTTALVYLLSKEGYILDAVNEKCFKPDQLFIINNCIFTEHQVSARYVIYNDGASLRYMLITFHLNRGDRKPLDNIDYLTSSNLHKVPSGYIFYEMMANVSTHTDACTIFELIQKYKIHTELDEMINPKALENMSRYLNMKPVDIGIDILAAQFDLPKEKVGVFYALGLEPAALISVLKHQAQTPHIAGNELPLLC